MPHSRISLLSRDHTCPPWELHIYPKHKNSSSHVLCNINYEYKVCPQMDAVYMPDSQRGARNFNQIFILRHYVYFTFQGVLRSVLRIIRCIAGRISLRVRFRYVESMLYAAKCRKIPAHSANPSDDDNILRMNPLSAACRSEQHSMIIFQAKCHSYSELNPICMVIAMGSRLVFL